MDNFQQTNVDLQSLVMSNGVSESFEKRMQILEMENGRLMKCQGQIIKETNRKLELYTNENRFLQYAFNKLKKQNEELRDLCYFLDDDRKEAKRLYNELLQSEQAKGYDSIKQVVTEHEEKIKCLEEREQLLIEDNRRLKLMCDSWIEFALKNSSVSRDCGDGSSDSETFYQKPKEEPSSASTNKSVEGYHNYENINVFDIKDINCHHENKSCEKSHQIFANHLYNDLFNYIKSLETRVQQLEKERITSTSESTTASTSMQVVVATDEDNNIKLQQQVDEDITPEPRSPKDPDCNNVWTERLDDDSLIYINQIRNDYYSLRDDNDNNIILSPIAEESETESSSRSSLSADEYFDRKRFPSKMLTVNLNCDRINGNDSLKMISRKNIKTSTNWNSIDGQNSHFRQASGERDLKCKRMNSTTSVDTFPSPHSLIDLFSNNLQSTTI